MPETTPRRPPAACTPATYATATTAMMVSTHDIMNLLRAKPDEDGESDEEGDSENQKNHHNRASDESDEDE